MDLKRKIFFDLESTGLDVLKSKIIQLTFTKFDGNGIKSNFSMWLNPEQEIEQGATDKHGKVLADLLEFKTFKEIAKDLLTFMEDYDLVGHNIMRFDIPLLASEFHRVGIPFLLKDRKIIDTLIIEQHLIPMNLESIYKRYTGLDLVGSHDSNTDVDATIEIFKHQITKDNLLGNYKDLGELTRRGAPRVDIQNKLTLDADGDLVYTFGKYANCKVKANKDTLGYAEWMMKGDFMLDTKMILKQLLNSLE